MAVSHGDIHGGRAPFLAVFHTFRLRGGHVQFSNNPSNMHYVRSLQELLQKRHPFGSLKVFYL